MVEAMAEKGIDMAYLKPGSMTDPSDGRHPDMVVSMGCENVCPGFPGASVKEWNIPDPSGKTLDFMQNVRDQVERKVDDLISEYGQ
jgi:arsenate reductase